LRFLENEKVLPRQTGFVFHEGESEGFELLARLSFGHFVQGLDGDAGILGAVFEEIDFPAGLEGFVEGGEHLDGVGEFVVGIDHERGVEGVGRELDVIDDSEVGLDVGDLAFGGFGF
jgi:hypothetical protein